MPGWRNDKVNENDYYSCEIICETPQVFQALWALAGAEGLINNRSVYHVFMALKPSRNRRLSMIRFIITFGDRLSAHLYYGSSHTALFTGSPIMRVRLTPPSCRHEDNFAILIPGVMPLSLIRCDCRPPLNHFTTVSAAIAHSYHRPAFYSKDG